MSSYKLCRSTPRHGAASASRLRNWSWVIFAIIAVAAPGSSLAQQNLGELISKAAEKGKVTVVAGTHTEPLKIDKPLQLVGTEVESSVLQVTSNQPAIHITTRKPVVIEGLTIKWQLETSDTKGPSSALLVKDGKVTIRNCRFVAMGPGKRCPSAVSGDGFSKIKIENCHFEGFEFTISIWGGAEGTVTDSVLMNPGRCGMTAGADSVLDASGNIVARSKYHGVRCTGGTIKLHDNLIVDNENRGVYLGNKSARGHVTNNAIIGNTTGISAFAQSNVIIQNNIIADSQFAGLDTRDSCRIKIKNNLFVGNTRGIVLVEKSGSSTVSVGKNSFWNNENNSEDIKLPASTIEQDPQFLARDDGDFTPQSEVLLKAKQGLKDAPAIQQLWQEWQRLK
jgi:nitrous oxidase accessory protein NosD